MRRAKPGELKTPAAPVLTAQLSESELLNWVPIQFDEITDPLATPEPTKGALVQLASGDYVVLYYGQDSRQLVVEIDEQAQNPSAILSAFLNEVPIPLSQVLWHRRDTNLPQADRSFRIPRGRESAKPPNLRRRPPSERRVDNSSDMQENESTRGIPWPAPIPQDHTSAERTITRRSKGRVIRNASPALVEILGAKLEQIRTARRTVENRWRLEAAAFLAAYSGSLHRKVAGALEEIQTALLADIAAAETRLTSDFASKIAEMESLPETFRDRQRQRLVERLDRHLRFIEEDLLASAYERLHKLRSTFPVE